MKRARFPVLVGCVLAMLLFGGLGGASADFVPLGQLPGFPFSSQAFGVSADGSTAVGVSRQQTGMTFPPTEAFRWTATGGMVGLGDLPGGVFQSQALGVSADGAVVVGFGTRSAPDPPTGTLEAFRWTAGGGMVGLGDLPGGFFRSQASGVSADGAVVVGGSVSALGSEAFRWTPAGGMVGLGILPGGVASGASGVSADGSVVVGSSSDTRRSEGFRWTATNGMVGLGFLGSFLGSNESFALGLSADGTVVVGVSTSDSRAGEAFRWTVDTGMISLGVLPGGSNSIARAVSADGSVVVGSGSSASGGAAFFWDNANGMRDLRDVLISQGDDLTGWTLVATGISADGRTIVGFGRNPAGRDEAWLARLNGPAVIPEPGSLTLLGLGALGLAGYCWRRRARAMAIPR
jgi:probable HAF family extracellular repeat protein